MKLKNQQKRSLFCLNNFLLTYCFVILIFFAESQNQNDFQIRSTSKEIQKTIKQSQQMNKNKAINKKVQNNKQRLININQTDQKLKISDQINLNWRNNRNLRKRQNIASTVQFNQDHINSRLLIQQLAIPVEFDWRNQISFTTIKNLGSCSSSYAFSTISFFQQQIIIKNNNTINISKIDLSQQFIISCDVQSFGCKNGYLDSAMDLIINNKGIPIQQQYKYNPYGIRNQQICLQKNVYPIQQTYRMSYYDITNAQTIKKILLKKPVNIAICAQDLNTYYPSSQKDRTLYCNPLNQQLDYSVLLIGYTQSQWIIKNQWGSQWGLDGYAYISRNPTQDCCIGRQMHITGKKTQNCNIEYCKTCIQQKTCFKCTNNRWVSHDYQTGVQSCQLCQHQNCQQCFDYYGQCNFCLFGYAIYKRTGLCEISIIQNCNFIQNNLCGQCHKGYLLSVNQKQCKPDCSINYCQKCMDGHCIVCKIGYYLHQVNSTQQCKKNSCNITGCFLCDINRKCLNCYKYYTLINNQCIAQCNLTNCARCDNNSTICKVCISGKSLNYITQICQYFPSVPNCSLHFSGICYTCKQGYQFNNDRTICNQICDTKNCSSCDPSDISICTKCKNGYFLQQQSGYTLCNKNPCSLVNCTLCDQTGQICLQCITKYHIFNTTTLACTVKCNLANCQLCLSTDTQCFRCKPTFVVQYDGGKCITSNIPYCTMLGLYNNSYECWQCQIGYRVDTQTWKKCIIDYCKDQNCQICDPFTLSICTKCLDGYSLQITDNFGTLKCILTPSIMPYCKKISSNQTYCFKCENYYIYNQHQMICQPYKINCPQNCQYCALPNTIQSGCKCKSPYIYDTSTKICSINPFQKDTKCIQSTTFSNSVLCIKCQPGYFITNNYQSCVPSCWQQMCQICYHGLINYCQKCKPGYFVSASSQCTKCKISNCNNCNTQFNNFCLLCDVGYKLSFNKTQCNQILCKQGQILHGYQCVCPKGLYMPKNTNICIQCIQENCDNCNINKCYQCKQGYYLNNNQKCIKCKDNCINCHNQTCLKCKKGYFFSQQSQICIQLTYQKRSFLNTQLGILQCPMGCSKCNSTNICNQCLIGWTFFKNTCLPCQNNCQTCLPSIPSSCITCKFGFVLQNKTCRPCSNKFCLKCQISPDYCSECIKGYYLYNQTCNRCQTGCIQCNSKSNCIKCSEGFGITQNRQCQRCIGNCTVCDPQNLFKCIQSCKIGQFMNQSSSLCEQCSDNCINCISNQQCTQCQQNYKLKSGICQPICKLQGCYQCQNKSSNNSLKCRKCFLGYTLSLQNSTCIPELSCNKNNQCIICPNSYYLSVNSTCLSCNLFSQNCLQCSNINPFNCIQCKKGFFVSNKRCQKCIDNCLECQNKNICQKCKNGFYLQKSQYGTTGRCIPCHSMCKTCIDSSIKCQTCPQGTILTQSLFCIPQRRISILIRLDLQIKNLKNAIRALIPQFLALLGINHVNKQELIQINKIKQGSIIMNVLLGIPSQQDQIKTLSSVRQKISERNQIAGIPILSVTKVNMYNGGDDEFQTLSEQQKNPTLLTLAIVLTIIFVIILITVGVIMKRKYFNSTNAVQNSSQLIPQNSVNIQQHFNQQVVFSQKQKKKRPNKIQPIKNKPGIKNKSQFNNLDLNTTNNGTQNILNIKDHQNKQYGINQQSYQDLNRISRQQSYSDSNNNKSSSIGILQKNHKQSQLPSESLFYDDKSQPQNILKTTQIHKQQSLVIYNEANQIQIDNIQNDQKILQKTQKFLQKQQNDNVNEIFGKTIQITGQKQTPIFVLQDDDE